MIERILLPSDGSEPAVQAQYHARLLARAFDAAVDLLAVTSDASTGKEQFAGAAAHLDGVTWETVTRSGRPATEILAYADESSCDVIVMGTHGRTGLERAITGSVTERVLRRSAVPVFTVRPGEETTPPSNYDRLCVPVDGSERSARAVEPAIELATAFDAAIDVVSVVDVSTIAAQSEGLNPSVISGELTEQCESALEQAKRDIERADVPTDTTVLRGSPSNAILEHVAAAGCDAVVMATHGRTGLQRALVGSTTERTIRRADVPVVSVAAADE